MKETSFIQQNKEKWSRFEKLYADRSKEPEELSDLYMDITDDLSYAQTFYKRRTVRVYLNQLTQKVFLGVNKQKGLSLRKFITVWKTSLPIEIYKARKSLLFALVTFLIYMGIGIITTHYNHDFPRIVMGDMYVNMTLENIQKGNPLAVYESPDQLSMFIMITTNNLKVAFLTFFAGFFFTLGTHLLLFSNGVMLGAFQYFFHLKGLLITSFLGIWIHGAFEISAIVLAGGAGITAGNGFLFPGSYTRLQSMQRTVKSGLKIMMSLVPFIIAAGFLESYVTHNYQVLPDWSKWTLILFSFAVILFVYVFYPIYVARKHPELLEEDDLGDQTERTPVLLYKMRGIGEVMSDSFTLFRSLIGSIVGKIFIIVAPLVGLIMYLQAGNYAEDMGLRHFYDWVIQLRILFGYNFSNPMDLLVFFVWSVILALVLASVFHSVKFKDQKEGVIPFFKYLIRNFHWIWLGNLIMYLFVFGLPWYVLIWAGFIAPLFFIQSAAFGLDERPAGTRWTRSWSYSANRYGTSLMVILMSVFIVFIISQPIAFIFSFHEPFNDQPLVRDLLDMLADTVKRVAMIYTDEHIFWSNIVRQIVYLLFSFMVIIFMGITMAVSYYSSREKEEAVSLREAFKRFGKRSRLKESQADFE